MTNILRYDDLGTINAVKLLPKIDSYNGYIQLYTELDSHIEEGDYVFITYSGVTTDINISSDAVLDNDIYTNYSDDFVYNSYAQGYKVIYVDKNINTFAINRLLISLSPKSKIYGHYVSKVVAKNINMTNTSTINIDGSLFKYANINGTNINIEQAIVLGGDILNEDITSNIENITIDDKYITDYLTLKLIYNEDLNIFTKVSTYNNSNYGYTYFYNLDNSIKECNIYSGIYSNCNISTISDKKIDGGYFSNCNIDNYDIRDGYFYFSNLTSTCKWYYGKWDGAEFTLNYWEDGIFINGIFGVGLDTIWQNGLFLNGTWRGITWVDGKFSGGLFEGTGYTVLPSNQNIVSNWLNGIFAGGTIQNSNFNTLYWKDGTIYGGEINNLTLNSGDIYGGNFYNVAVKNCNIYDGNFEIIKDSLPVYNYFANDKIYGGVFNGTWNVPTANTCGFNEFSDSEIFNGDFTYPAFYNNNIINDGNFVDGLFYSPITINNGKFSGGHDNLISGTTYQRSNQFKAEKYNLNKAIIRNILLIDNTNTVVEKMYIEFDDTHNFTSNDINTTVKLVGFNSQELYNLNATIINSNLYKDPSNPIIVGSTFTYAYIDPIGSNYIIVETPYENWYFGDSGLVRKAEYPNYIYSEPISEYIINNGKFNNTTFNGNIRVNYGVFNYVTMSNGINWYDGIFNGSYFQSLSGETQNNWYNGRFYNGYFGKNLTGLKDTTLIAIFDDRCHIDDSAEGLLTGNTYTLSSIYPLVYSKNISTNIQTELENNILIDFAAFGSLNGFDNQLYENDSEWSRFVTDDRSKNYMNSPVWNRGNTYNANDISNSIFEYNFSPYEFVFTINCSSDLTRLYLTRYIDYVVNSTDFYIGIASHDVFIPDDPNDPNDIDNEPFKTFKTLFDMDYNFKEYIIGADTEGYPLYLIFEFETIKDLFLDCTESEKNLFLKNYRNVWSVANNGYYTYPMPVLNNGTYGTEDLDLVGKMSVRYDSNQYNDQNKMKWIYGTCPPPWWYNINNTSPNINWNTMFTELEIPNQSDFEIGTLTNGGVEIYNNNSSCETWMINKDIILDTLLSAFSFAYYDVYNLDNDNNIKPYDNIFTDWMFYNIYQHKNQTGKNFNNDINFRTVHRDQLLYDSYFNNIADYKTEPFWKLGKSLIYNSTKFKCRLQNNKLYFERFFDLNSYFNTGDTLYIEVNSFGTWINNTPAVESNNQISLGSLPPVPIYSTNIVQSGTYEILSISGYSYDVFDDNVILIDSPTNLFNDEVYVYVQNNGLIEPYWYNVYDQYNGMNANGNNGLYDDFIDTNLTSSAIFSHSYKEHINKVAIRYEPVLHSYNYIGISASTLADSIYINRDLFQSKILKSGNTYKIILGNISCDCDELIWNPIFNAIPDPNNPDLNPDYGSNTAQTFIDINEILEKLKYVDGDSWLSVKTIYDNDDTKIFNNTWRIGNSGITDSTMGSPSGRLYFDLLDIQDIQDIKPIYKIYDNEYTLYPLTYCYFNNTYFNTGITSSLYPPPTPPITIPPSNYFDNNKLWNNLSYYNLSLSNHFTKSTDLNTIYFPTMSGTTNRIFGTMYLKLNDGYILNADRIYSIDFTINREIDTVLSGVTDNKIILMFNEQKWSWIMESGETSLNIKLNVHVPEDDINMTYKYCSLTIEHGEYDLNTVNVYSINKYDFVFGTDNTLDIDVEAGLEPTVSCAGKISKINTGSLIGCSNISYNCSILDYDWVNKCYVFDLDATDNVLNNLRNSNINLEGMPYAWFGTSIASKNMFNIDDIPSGTNDIPSIYGPINSPKYSIPDSDYTEWHNSINPVKTLTYESALYGLENDPDKDYLLNILSNCDIQYSGNSTKPVSFEYNLDGNIINPIPSVIFINKQNIQIPIYENIILNDNWKGQNDLNWLPTNTDYSAYKILSVSGFGNKIEYETLDFIKTTNLDFDTNLIFSIKTAPALVDSRINIKKIELSEKISNAEFKIEYPLLYIDENVGMTSFGISATEQSQIYNQMTYTNPWLPFNINRLSYKNFQDMVVFDSYHRFKKGSALTYVNGLNLTKLYKLFTDMKNGNATNYSSYSNFLSTTDKDNFKKWNQYCQTSVQNFNKKAGIEIFSKNILVDIEGFQDEWYNGEFYNGRFEGKWNGGKWINGSWWGWNSLNEGNSLSAITSFEIPSTFSTTAIKNKNYEIDYKILKQRKLYYDIAPWDVAKNNDVVNLPPPKKNRNI